MAKKIYVRHTVIADFGTVNYQTENYRDKRMITVYIDDILEYPSSGSIHVKCSTDTDDTFDLVLDIVKMRIDWNGEFEDELQHDIQKEYNALTHNGTVDVTKLKEKLELYDYGMI